MNDLIPASPAVPTAMTLARPLVSPAELMKYHDDVVGFIQSALIQGVDYGTIPGAGDKPALFKAGAEKINLAFGATPEYEIAEKEIDHDREVKWSKRKKVWKNAYQGDRRFDWASEDGTSFGLYRYVVRCRLRRGEERVLGSGLGSCSTLESKYVDRPRDLENTVLKMAQKRAYVAATLHAYGLSDRFTQDVEESAPKQQPEAATSAEPKPDAPKKIYRGTTEQQEVIKRIILGMGVPEEFWGEIDQRLMGRDVNELEAVVKAVKFGEPDTFDLSEVFPP